MRLLVIAYNNESETGYEIKYAFIPDFVLNPSSLKLLKAYKLPCSYIIHTVGPVWYGGRHEEYEHLQDCYRNLLQVAVDPNLRRIAFLSISTGGYGYPVDEAAKTALYTVSNTLSIKIAPPKLIIQRKALCMSSI